MFIYKYYKRLLSGLSLVLLLFPFVWIIPFIGSLVVLLRKQKKRPVITLLCVAIIIYCVIKCVLVMGLFYYHSQQPEKFRDFEMFLQRYSPWITYFAPFEPEYVYSIDRTRAIEMLSRVNDYNSKNLSEEEIDLLRDGDGFLDLFDGKLRFTQKGQRLLIYSIGPDRIDNRAAIIYDTTNGITSDGDIFSLH